MANTIIVLHPTPTPLACVSSAAGSGAATRCTHPDKGEAAQGLPGCILDKTPTIKSP